MRVEIQNAKLAWVIVGLLSILLVWFGAAIVRLENHHYAVQVGMCDQYDEAGNIAARADRDDCLNHTQTRTHSLWHLLYGLGVL
jgi:hypothetical protein